METWKEVLGMAVIISIWELLNVGSYPEMIIVSLLAMIYWRMPSLIK